MSNIRIQIINRFLQTFLNAITILMFNRESIKIFVTILKFLNSFKNDRDFLILSVYKLSTYLCLKNFFLFFAKIIPKAVLL